MPEKNNEQRRKNKKKPSELVSYGDFRLPPVVPGPEVDDLCRRIDDFYSKYPKQHRKQKASDLIKGAFYAMRPECRSNLDWISQAANSARDVLYPLFSEDISSNNLIKLFKKYAINQNDKRNIKNREFTNTFGALDKIYKQLSDLTHHGTNLKAFSQKQFSEFSESDFENLIKDFTFVLGRAFSLQQIYIHTIVDVIVKKKRRSKAVKNDLSLILKVNPDAHQYFYTKADESWLNWLRRNGFLDVIKERAADPTRYGYRTPELNYLVRMTEKVPARVVDIILDVKVSKETFNPEVVDRFSWICSILPAKELARVVPKIREENWIPLMGPFNRWGFEYEKMFKTLADAKNYKSILVLAKAILVVRSKEEVGKDGFAGISTENPFYFNDLSYTKVFEHLANISGEDAEQALALATKVMGKIVLLGGDAENNAVFPIEEIFHLYDVDFFSLESGKKKHLSYRDDVRELATVIKILAQRLIGDRCDEPNNVRRIYQECIQSLPPSRAMWRLRLFVLSLCPEVFRDELKEAFFKVFREDNKPWELIWGAEYEHAIHKGFSALSKDDQRDYVSRALDYFGKREGKDTDLWKHYGWSILSSVFAELTNGERGKAEEIFGKPLDPDFEPEPSIKMDGFARMIIPQAPDEKNWTRPVPEITEKLLNEWSIRTLIEKYKDTDFYRPTGAEGAGDRLKQEVLQRPLEFLENAQLFFNRESLDPHYTYSFLRGVHDALHEKKITVGVDVNELFAMLSAVASSGKKEPFNQGAREQETFGGWLVGWAGVHNAMADLMKELLIEDNKPFIDFTSNRSVLLESIAYLLDQPNPEPKDEEEEPARPNFRSETEYTGSDPFTEAINSVRGQAFEALALFVYQDSEKFKDADIKIANDVKEIYEYLLKRENTHAVMFMFGHYLPTFYFRDKVWIRGLLPQMFPESSDKKDLYIAAWEGFLVNNLYKELFSDPLIAALYQRAISLDPNDYTKRRYFKNLDDGLAIHLALAFIYLPEFGFEHNLFKRFWNDNNTKRHKEFISFIGRYGISRDAVAEWVKYNEIDVDKLKEFWDWALEYCEADALDGFGYWIKVEQGVLDIKWLAQKIHATLKRTKGHLEWDYGLTRSIVNLAEAAPKDTLEIARLYWLEGGVRGSEERRPWHIDNEWSEVFQILYKNPLTKEGTYALIDDLIREGGSAFWKLKEILDK